MTDRTSLEYRDEFPRKPHDPSGKLRLPPQPGVTGNVVFSTCGRYRYWLCRHWATPGVPTPYALWIGMNPSTEVGNFDDDPTIIRHEIAITKAHGMRAYIQANVFDYRTNNPKDLRLPGVEPCSPHNIEAITDLANEASVIVAAWGHLPAVFKPHVRNVIDAIGPHRIIMCLGTNKDGSPKRPLSVSRSAVLIPWRS